MEKYDLLGKLEAKAQANGWVFLAGDNFYQNYESVMHEYEPGQCIIGVDFVASDVFNEWGSLTEINYIGSIRLGRKVDANTGLTASLDETFKQKHDRRLLDLKLLLSQYLTDLACENQLQITNSVGILEINKFDSNIDFVGLQITFNQMDFESEIPVYYDLIMSSLNGGTIQPAPGTYPLLKNEIVPICATPAPGYTFVKWLINGATDINNLTTVKMTSIVTAIASFTRAWLLTIEQPANGQINSNVPAGNVNEGTSVTVQAVAIPNYEVDNLFVNDVPQTNPTTFIMDAAKTVRAVMRQIGGVFRLTIAKVGNGAVNPDVGQYDINSGEPYSIEATETDNDYYFDYFDNDGVHTTTNPLTGTMTANKLVTAVFTAYDYILNVFSQIPTFINNKWQYEDLTGTGNHLATKNIGWQTNGTTDYDYSVQDANTALGTSDFTIAVRCVPLAYGTLCSMRNGANLSYPQISISGTTISGGVNQASGNLDAPVIVPLNQLATIVVQKMSTEWSLWLNNAKLVTKSVTGQNYNNGDFSVSAYRNSTVSVALFASAIIESACVEKREWTALEIQNYSESGVMPATVMIGKIYNQTSGIYTPDLSGNNRNGFRIGNNWVKSDLIKPSLLLGNYSKFKYDIRKYYNQYAIDTGKLAPAGWRVPTNADIVTLYTYLGGISVAGGKLKEAGTFAWNTANAGDSSSGFLSRGAGYAGASFIDHKIRHAIWTSTNAHGYFCVHNSNAMTSWTGLSKAQGMPVRLVKTDSVNPGTITDLDGNVYNCVTIGTQVWLTSDFKCTKYNDGVTIPFYTNVTTFNGLTTAGSINSFNESESDEFNVSDLMVGGKLNCYGFTKISDVVPTGYSQDSQTNVVVPVNTDLNAFITAGEKTWADIDSIPTSVNVSKQKTGTQITSMIVKKKLNNNSFPYDLPFDL